MKPLAIMTAAAVVATLLMLVSPVNAHNRAADVRPKPRPLMDCRFDAAGMIVACEVRG